MILTAKSIVDLEREDRRVLGALRMIDDASRAPLVVPGTVDARRADLIDIAGPGAPTVVSQVPIGFRAVTVRQNRNGWFVVFGAPLFDAYTGRFADPVNPPELAATQRLRLRLRITDAGPNHFPRFADVTLPRALDRAAVDSVFTPQDVRLLRAPAAPMPDGWAVLRVTVRQTGTRAALGGVLVRVFRQPQAGNAEPIGMGLTEWRDAKMRGEAAVPIPRLARFAPGGGANVMETTHRIALEATRDQNFPAPGNAPATEEPPDIDQLIAGAGPGIVRRSTRPPPPILTVTRPPTPISIAAGEELTVELEMP